MATFLGYSNFNGKNGSKFSADLLYDILEQNVSGNYTVVRLYGYIRSWGYSGSGSYATFSINGVNSGGFNRINANQYSEVARRDIQIMHNAEGKANLDWSLFVDTSWSLGDASASGSIALPTIPRKSNVTCTDGSIGSSVSINIQRASNNFTHTLKYSFGSLSGTIATGVGSSYGWTLPDSFYSQIPNSKEGVGTITCETYSGGAHIGTTSTGFRAYAVEGNCNPQVSATIEDINPLSVGLTGDKNKLVKGVSNAHIKITASARKSASLRNTGATCNDGKSANGNDITLNAVESGTFNVFATDSRGYTKYQEYNKTIVNYIPLTCNINIYRPQPTTGEVNLDISGNYFNENFGKTSNTLSLKYRFKKRDESFGNYVTIKPTISGNKYSYSASLGTGFDYKNAYDFEIVASDMIKSLSIPYHLAEGIPMMALFKDHIEMFGKKTIYTDGTNTFIEGATWKKFSKRNASSVLLPKEFNECYILINSPKIEQRDTQNLLILKSALDECINDGRNILSFYFSRKVASYEPYHVQLSYQPNTKQWQLNNVNVGDRTILIYYK